MGTGEMTGRGFGSCAGVSGMEYGGGRGRGRGRGLCLGFNRRRGFGRGLGFDRCCSGDQKELLQKQKSFLLKRLAEIDKQLENVESLEDLEDFEDLEDLENLENPDDL